MRSFALAFLLGVLFLQTLIYLPNKEWVGLLGLLILLMELILCKHITWTRLVFPCLMGFAWSLIYAHALLSWTLPNDAVGKPVLMAGYVASIPNNELQRTTFLFAIKKYNQQSAHGLIKLSVNNMLINLHVGDQWQFLTRVKKIHSLMNPGGFDYEALALQQGIRATGYVVNSPENKLLSSHWYRYLIDRVRQALAEKIQQILPLTNTSPWIMALALGERQGISAENWEVLRNTGTNHLMAIAGLHIGLMAGFMYAIISACWRRIPWLVLRLPAQQAGAIAALCMAFIYSALAGFSLPTQRAVIMLSVFFSAALLRRKVLSWQAWSIALFCVLLFNPMDVLTDSFWLSFTAVALIIYGIAGRLSPQGLWWKFGRIQWVLTIGLIPFGVWLFQQSSLIAFVANSIAIPWVGFIVLPLTLLGCLLCAFSTNWGGAILTLADKILSVLWKILTYLAHLHWASWYQAMPNHWVLFAACVSVMVWLLPAGFPGRYFSIIGLLPLVLYHAPEPPQNEFNLTLLDVGQGLSAVIQTAHHLLVFDAGAKFNNNYDMGESVVAPFLRSINAKQINLLVVSHGDNDHLGGTGALLNYFSILATKTSVPGKLLAFRPTYCLAGQSWQWDGVNFSFLYPTKDRLNLDNNSSCVLKVSNQYHSVLLTGDIEKRAERVLVASQINNLAAEILIAPHHGSKTSAVAEFLTAVHPHVVFFPVGYQNRYHFPTLSVVQKYRELGVLQYDTAQDGAIQFHSALNDYSLYRGQHQHYWSQK